MIESELRNFNAICLTETWLDRRTSGETIKMNGFNLCRCDRDDDSHGGICVYINIFEPRHDKTCLREFPTRPDTNRPAQPLKLARNLKFRIEKLEILYYPRSEQQRR